MKVGAAVRRRLLACVAAQCDTLHIVWLRPNRIRGEVRAAEQNIPEHPGTGSEAQDQNPGRQRDQEHLI